MVAASSWRSTYSFTSRGTATDDRPPRPGEAVRADPLGASAGAAPRSQAARGAWPSGTRDVREPGGARLAVDPHARARRRTERERQGRQQLDLGRSGAAGGTAADLAPPGR